MHRRISGSFARVSDQCANQKASMFSRLQDLKLYVCFTGVKCELWWHRWRWARSIRSALRTVGQSFFDVTVEYSSPLPQGRLKKDCCVFGEFVTGALLEVPCSPPTRPKGALESSSNLYNVPSVASLQCNGL